MNRDQTPMAFPPLLNRTFPKSCGWTENIIEIEGDTSDTILDIYFILRLKGLSRASMYIGEERVQSGAVHRGCSQAEDDRY
jgi:hypothetical protein